MANAYSCCVGTVRVNTARSGTPSVGSVTLWRLRNMRSSAASSDIKSSLKLQRRRATCAPSSKSAVSSLLITSTSICRNR